MKHKIKFCCLLAGLQTCKIVSGLAACPKAVCLVLHFMSLWLLEERTRAWFDWYLEAMLGKSFIQAFHKLLATSG